jgi:glycosyltransferase involved in cell wall biosynthesis
MKFRKTRAGRRAESPRNPFVFTRETATRQANAALAEALDSVPASVANVKIHITPKFDMNSAAGAGVAGSQGERGTVFFWEDDTKHRPRLTQDLTNRIRDLIQCHAPLGLDSVRQVVNKFINYRAPSPSNLPVAPSVEPIDWSNKSAGAPVMLVGMNWLDVGGAEAFAIEAAELASTMGFRVVIVCDRHGPLTWLSRAQVFAEHIYLLGKLDAQSRHSVCFRIVLEHQPQLIHIHHCKTLYDLLPHLRTAGFKNSILDSTHIVENRHGGFVAESQHYSSWLDHHHVISRTLENFYREAGISPDKIQLGYLCRSSPVEKKPTSKGGSSLKVGFVGRLAQQKRPYIFVELARRLAAAQPGAFSFEMIGDGPLAKMVRGQIKSSNAQVTLRPSQTNVPDFLARMDVLVVCSDAEGLTLVAFEAILQNCAVVSTNVGAQRELIEPPMLLPTAPYAFLRAATDLLLRISNKTVDIGAVKAQQGARYSQLCSAPHALRVCRDIYEQAGRLSEIASKAG